MFWVPRGWVPYYVEWILSFPRAPLGSVSMQVWAAACLTVIVVCGEAVKGSVEVAAAQKERKRKAAAGKVGGGEKKEL